MTVSFSFSLKSSSQNTRDPQKSLLCEPASTGRPGGCSKFKNICAPRVNAVFVIFVRSHAYACNCFVLFVSNLNFSKYVDNAFWVFENMLKIFWMHLEGVWGYLEDVW